MNVDETLKKITDFYLQSRDFNGIHIADIGENFTEVKKALKELLEKDKVVLNFGDRHKNIHILALEPEPKEEQLQKLENLQFQEPIYKQYGPLKIQTNSVNCCVYPARSHLISMVDKQHYKNKPYDLMLALGEPQLSYRAFNLRVLEFYRNEPRYSYETDDVHGSISTKTEGGLEGADDTFIQTFGFAYDKGIKNRYVAVFLRYLSDLTSEHQQRWKLEEFNGETFLHPDYAKTTSGHLPERVSIFSAFCEEIRIINEITTKITGNPLFRKTYESYNKPKKFEFLVRPTKEEYENFIQLIDKMMSDNLNKEFFRGNIDTQNKSTITLLEEWLNKSVNFPDPKPKDEMIKAFRDIRNERSKPAHHIRDDEWDNQYFVKQRETIKKAYKAIRTLRLIFANHPIAKTAEVPDWLYKGEIWTF